MCHTKYNDGLKNQLNILATKDTDECDFGKGGRAKLRENKKEKKYMDRSIGAGSHSPFTSRGLTLNNRIQVVELAQFEENKVREI